MPSGYGSIRYLGKRRSKPYAVHPPATDRDPKTGEYIRPPVICYASSWYVAYAVLAEYKAGRYQKGMEYQIEAEYEAAGKPETALNDFIARILRSAPNAADLPINPTLNNVYEEWYDWKYGEHAAKKLSPQSQKSTSAAFSQLKQIHNREMDSLTLSELQDIINNLGKSRSTTSNVVGLLKQLYKYAVPRELVSKDLGPYIVMPSTPDQVHHEAFTEDELKILWKNVSDPRAAMVVIMCYSGFRVSAYNTLEINHEEGYFKGGVKTASGKNRIVPIHSAIKELVKLHEPLLRRPSGKIVKDMADVLAELSLPAYTPHSCRHTFSALCERYGVNENDRKRMMGHSFGNDTTNAVYGHRTLEDLRNEIEKICGYL